MPPSIHPATGQPYRWQDEDAPAAAIPPKLSELLRPPPPSPTVRAGSNASAVGLLRTVVGAPEGNRNNVLYWASCRAAESGILDDQVAALLIDAAVTAGAGGEEDAGRPRVPLASEPSQGRRRHGGPERMRAPGRVDRHAKLGARRAC
jgi:hypothetical protein